jgi:hypothetical protein
MVQELINRIVQNVGIDPAVAQSAVSIIMGFLAKEGPQAQVSELMAAIPGAQALVDAQAQAGGGGGLMGMLGGLMGGGSGGLMGVMGQLNEAGLGMGEVQGVTQEIVGFAKEKASPELVDQVLSSIPGLGQFVR